MITLLAPREPLVGQELASFDLFIFIHAALGAWAEHLDSLGITAPGHRSRLKKYSARITDYVAKSASSAVGKRLSVAASEMTSDSDTEDEAEVEPEGDPGKPSEPSPAPAIIGASSLSTDAPSGPLQGAWFSKLKKGLLSASRQVSPVAPRSQSRRMRCTKVGACSWSTFGWIHL